MDNNEEPKTPDTEPNKVVTHQEGYPIGEAGQSQGFCCGNGCIDCEFWCK